MSSNVYLSNIDDYLAPSQACVNPLFTTDKDKGKDTKGGKEVEVEVEVKVEVEEKKENDEQAPIETSAAVVVPKQRHRRKRVSARMNLNIGDKSTTAPPVVPSDPVKASIQDCLACSGCVTTAETVLMEQQHSLTILRDMVAARAVRSEAEAEADTHTDTDVNMETDTDQEDQEDLPEIVVTVSPASWADLLRHIMGDKLNTPDSDTSNSEKRPLREYQRKLVTMLHRTLHVSTVMDGNLPLQWSLKQAGDEFCRAHGRKYSNGAAAVKNGDLDTDAEMMDADAEMMDADVDANDTTITAMSEQERLQQQLMPSQALSSSRSVYMRPDGTQLELTKDTMVRQQQALPLITSSCPAVVCLLEKSTHAAVPHLSTTKSSMAAAGAYWKQQHATANIATTTSKSKHNYFHLAIMPCHDKKLEASRKDFQQDVTPDSPKDVDMVITTSECFQLLLELLTNKTAVAADSTVSGASAGTEGNDSITAASKDTNNAKDTTQAGIAMIRDYLESLPMAPVQESVGPCHPMTIPLDESSERNGNDVTIRTKKNSNATLMALPSTATAGATTATTVTTATNGKPTAKPTAKLLPSTVSSTSTSSDTFFALGSGGYADYVFRYAAREIYGVDIDVVPWKPVTGAQVIAGGSGGGARQQQQQQQQPRTSARVATSAQRRRDFYQATLYRSSDGSYFTFDETTPAPQSESHEAVLRFAVAYGMQTIQRVFEPFQDKEQGAGKSSSLVAPTKSPYDYIEAMACPSGCLNGGGQNRVAERETPTETRQRVSRTTQFFDSQSSSSSTAVAAPLEPAQLVTSYHVVPPLELSMGAAAGVAVKDIQW